MVKVMLLGNPRTNKSNKMIVIYKLFIVSDTIKRGV